MLQLLTDDADKAHVTMKRAQRRQKVKEENEGERITPASIVFGHDTLHGQPRSARSGEPMPDRSVCHKLALWLLASRRT